jgi:hypothetical protein
MRQKSKAVRFMKGFANVQLTANMDLTSLTIRAMQDAARPEPEKDTQQTVRPVRTPLDGQVREHERQRCVKAIKRASGAESMEEALDFDFSLLRRREEPDCLGPDFMANLRAAGNVIVKDRQRRELDRAGHAG